jgi:hypothetical protein
VRRQARRIGQTGPRGRCGIADQAQKQGHILTSEQFHALFVAEYPRLVAPDAT